MPTGQNSPSRHLSRRGKRGQRGALDGLQGGPERPAGHLGVAERGGNAAVAEGLLDQPDIAGLGQEPVGQGMPENVWRELSRYARPLMHVFQHFRVKMAVQFRQGLSLTSPGLFQ